MLKTPRMRKRYGQVAWRLTRAAFEGRSRRLWAGTSLQLGVGQCRLHSWLFTCELHGTYHTQVKLII